jgi:hypothetical protein
MGSLVKIGVIKGARTAGATPDSGRWARGGSKKPTAAQVAYLKRGLGQPGGKLPLFDGNGREISARTIRACIRHGWAEPWFSNPVKPDWLVCRLTARGRALVARRSSR